MFGVKIELYNDNFQNYKVYNIPAIKACAELNRHCYGFEIDKKFYMAAKYQMLKNTSVSLFC